jgi:hypothetical protein
MSTTPSVCVCPTSALPKRNTFLPNLLLRVAPDRDSTQWIRRPDLRGGSDSRLFSGQLVWGCCDLLKLVNASWENGGSPSLNSRLISIAELLKPGNITQNRNMENGGLYVRCHWCNW